MGLALHFCWRIRARLNNVPKAWTRSGRATRPAPAAPHRQEFEAGLKGTSRNRQERFPMHPFPAIAPLRDRTP